MPATLAILSIVFVESIYSSLGVTDPTPGLTHKLWSLLVLLIVTTLNSISTKTSTRLGGFFVVVKLFTIFLLIIAGLTVVFVFLGKHKDLGGGDWHRKGWFEPRDTPLPGGGSFDWSKVGTWESLGFYSTALYGALWAYSGWDKANYVAAELKNPKKQLSLAINTAIPTIIVCYVAANAVYYVLLPWKVVSITDAAAVVSKSTKTPLLYSLTDHHPDRCDSFPRQRRCILRDSSDLPCYRRLCTRELLRRRTHDGSCLQQKLAAINSGNCRSGRTMERVQRLRRRSCRGRNGPRRIAYVSHYQHQKDVTF